MSRKRKSGRVIIAPQYVKLKGPVIFLAGPIQGATEWQKLAVDYIRNLESSLNIASPRRPELTQGDFPDYTFNKQVDWEHHYLKRAAKNGVILFWLAKEEVHRCDRAYGQTTRFELGEAIATHRFKEIKVVVGIEDGFPGARYIRKTLSKKYPDIPICDNLEGTCRTAVRLSSTGL